MHDISERHTTTTAVCAALTVLCLGAPSTRGDITYSLHLGGVDPGIAAQVTASVQEAVAVYNRHGSFNKHLNVYYNAGVPTAQANYDGVITFGGSRNTRVALHEMGHTVGIGTFWAYGANMVGGVWQGAFGRALALEQGSPYAEGILGDSVHIWPWGLNYDSEDGYQERIKHVRIMAAMRCDMGIMAYSKEAEHATVATGGTAEFRVQSPLATGYQWYKDGTLLANGGDISGANSATLRIANAGRPDEGTYHCAATGAGETLNSRPRRLMIEKQVGQWDLDGNTADSVGIRHGTAYGSPVYTTGRIGQAIDLDGVNDYVTLPAGVADTLDITMAAWVNWDGGGDWQRILDFGTGTSHYLFLTPRSGSGTLRFAAKDGWDAAEQILETAVLPTGQWVHLAVVMKGDVAVLYVNGRARDTHTGLTVDPIDIAPSLNYIGESQFSADPLFDGRIDDVRVYNHALPGAAVWNLWGGSSNQPPVFSTDPIVLPAAVAGSNYTGYALADYAGDPDNVTLTYSKLGGPGWLGVASDGSLSGTPGSANQGMNTFVVRVTDHEGASSDAELRVEVVSSLVDFDAGPLAVWDFNDPVLGAANGGPLPDSDGRTVWRKAAADKSGNGNHLTTWEYDWAGFTWSDNSPAGDFSIRAAGSYPAAYTWSAQSAPGGADIESVTLTNFTVEAAFTTAGSGFRTVVGRDARNVSSLDARLAAFYMTIDPENHPRAVVVDVNGDTAVLTASGITVANDNATWYHMAVVNDGSSVSIYWNGVEAATTDLALGALAAGIASGPDWHPGGWSVGRGLYDGGHTDRWFGYIDAVAVSGRALAPAGFVIDGYGLWADDQGIAGASFESDADTDGVPNGIEYYLGSDPRNPLLPGDVLTWSEDLLSVTYPYNPSAYGVRGMVEWATDLVAGDWTDAGVTYVTNTLPDTIEATFDASTSDQRFVRLTVVY